MITVDVIGQVVTVAAGHRDTMSLKLIPGCRYNKARDVWTVPFGLTALACLGDFPGAQYTDGAVARFGELAQWADRQAARRDATDPIEGREFLYPFQAAGVRFIAAGKRVLVADEMGTGKTVQTLVAIDQVDAYPLLVVCPNSLKHNWAKEVEQWTDATPVVVEGTAAQRKKLIAEMAGQENLVAIINYESLVKHTKQASFGNTVLTDEQKAEKDLNDIQWQAVVVDEAHRIKSPKAHSTRAVWGVSRDAEYRVALTGTPVVNNPDDLWSILHFLIPEEQNARARFRDMWCHVVPGYHGGLENLGLREGAPRRQLDVILKPMVIRRTKGEVLPDLPEKILTNRLVPISGKQRTVYNQLVSDMMAEVHGGILVATDPLTLLGRLRYAASATPVVDDDGNVLSLDTPSNKLSEIKDIIAESDGPLVVYGESRKLMELIEAELPEDLRIGVITGAIPARARQGFVDMFQAGDLDVMLATTGAGAEGITLTAASRMVVVQESWSNVANKQAHDRIHRIGQDRGTEIITLITEGTVDVAVHQATVEKEDQLQSLVRDPEWFIAAIRGDL